MLTLKLFPNGEYSIYPPVAVSNKKRPSQDRKNPLGRCDKYYKGSNGVIYLKEGLGDELSDRQPRWYVHHSGGIYIKSIPSYNGMRMSNYSYTAYYRDGRMDKISLSKPVEQMYYLEQSGNLFVPCEKLPLLVYQQVHSSEKVQKPRNRKVLGFRGKRMIRNLASCLQESIGKHNLAFLTLTVPAFSPEYSSSVRANWGLIVRDVLNTISHKYRYYWGKGMPYLSVTEYQEKRFAKYKDLLPHEHIIYHARRPDGRWLFSPAQIRRIWARCIARRLRGLVSSVPGYREYSSCENLRVVRKDVACYLSKYLSKGSGATGEDHDSREYHRQSSEVSGRWYRASRCAYQLVKAGIRLVKNVSPGIIPRLRRFDYDRKPGEGRYFSIHETVINFSPIWRETKPGKKDDRRQPAKPKGIHIYIGWMAFDGWNGGEELLGILSEFSRGEEVFT